MAYIDTEVKKMNRQELNKILEKHKLWLYTNGAEGERTNLRGADLRGASLRSADLSYADLSYADLRSANLRGADLRSADLDYSAFPLWCGSLNVHIDDRQAIQLLYHLVMNVMYSKNTSAGMKKLCRLNSVIKKANEFHRVNECGKIEGASE